MRKYFQLLSTAMKMEVKEHRSSFIVYAILRILVVLSMIRQFFNGNYENVFLCLLTLLLLIVPELYSGEIQDRTADRTGDYYSAVYLCSRNTGRNTGVLYHHTFLGHSATYSERLLAAAIDFHWLFC